MGFSESYFDDREDMCFRCGSTAVPDVENDFCVFCSGQVPSGRVLYACKNCGHQWVIGGRTARRGEAIVCVKCHPLIVGNCMACGTPTVGAAARKVHGAIVCRTCFAEEESIWCPKCERVFRYSGYLRFAFFGDRPGCHAAALVTHYRHEHVASYDRAWQDPHYARRIPYYDRDLMREEVNNRAKRQLIRAIKKHVANETYPPTAPVNALELIRAFTRLQSNDDKTQELISQTLTRLEQPVATAPARRRRPARIVAE